MKNALLLVLFLSLIYAQNRSSGASLEHVLEDEDLIRGGSYFVIVAIVENVEKLFGTNGNPPKVLLNVQDVLEGNMELGRIQGICLPFPHDIDYDGGDSSERLEKWSKLSLKSLEKGSKMILIGRLQTNHSGFSEFYISSRCRFIFSEEKHLWVLKNIEAGRNSRLKFQKEKQELIQAEEEKRTNWIQAKSTVSIPNLLSSSDFVGVGSIYNSGLIYSQIKLILKGGKREDFPKDFFVWNLNILKEDYEILFSNNHFTPTYHINRNFLFFLRELEENEIEGYQLLSFESTKEEIAKHIKELNERKLPKYFQKKLLDKNLILILKNLDTDELRLLKQAGFDSKKEDIVEYIKKIDTENMLDTFQNELYNTLNKISKEKYFGVTHVQVQEKDKDWLFKHSNKAGEIIKVTENKLNFYQWNEFNRRQIRYSLSSEGIFPLTYKIVQDLKIVFSSNPELLEKLEKLLQ